MKAAGRDTEAAAAGAGCYTAVLCLAGGREAACCRPQRNLEIIIGYSHCCLANRYSAEISICRVVAAADFLHFLLFKIILSCFSIGEIVEKFFLQNLSITC